MNKYITKGTARKTPKLRMLGQLTVLSALAVATSAHALDAFDVNSPWMSGDWGGARTDLLNKGYDFSLEYVGEVGSNLKGGYNDDTTARYSDQFALGVKFDLQKILGWHDAEAKVTITERSGRNISNDRIGDPRAGTFSSSQEVWGRGQTYRLTQLWIKQKYFDGALDVKVGRYGPGEDFNSFPATSRTWRSAARKWVTGWAACGTTGPSASGRFASSTSSTRMSTHRSVPSTRTRPTWSQATASR